MNVNVQISTDGVREQALDQSSARALAKVINIWIQGKVDASHLWQRYSLHFTHALIGRFD